MGLSEPAVLLMGGGLCPAEGGREKTDSVALLKTKILGLSASSFESKSTTPGGAHTLLHNSSPSKPSWTGALTLEGGCAGGCRLPRRTQKGGGGAF